MILLLDLENVGNTYDLVGLNRLSPGDEIVAFYSSNQQIRLIGKDVAAHVSEVQLLEPGADALDRDICIFAAYYSCFGRGDQVCLISKDLGFRYLEMSLRVRFKVNFSVYASVVEALKENGVYMYDISSKDIENRVYALKKNLIEEYSSAKGTKDLHLRLSKWRADSCDCSRLYSTTKRIVSSKAGDSLWWKAFKETNKEQLASEVIEAVKGGE